MRPLFLAAALILAFLFGAARAHADVEDVLLERGMISKEDWVKIKADKEKLATAGKGLEYRAEAPRHQSIELLKGIEIGLTVYLDFTYAMGDSFTADRPHNGLNEATAENNRGLAQGFHFTRTYFNLRKYWEGGHHARLTLDQMVNNVGNGGGCPSGNSDLSGGNCHEAAPFGLSGFAGKGRNMTFVKYAYYNHIIIPGLELRVGQGQTPWIEYEEHRWTYRYLFPTMVDQQNFQTSSDLGASVLGKILDNRVEYHASFMNGEGYQNTPNGRGFAVLGRVSVEPIKGVIFSAFGHTERLRNGVEGFNPKRALGNIEFYDPTSDRFKLNLQAVWADDGDDVGNKKFAPLGQTFNVPATYNGSASTAAATYGSTNGPSTSLPRFHQGRGYEIWAWVRVPGVEKVRLHGRYYFMKPNKETQAGDIQAYYAGISYDYSKWLAFSLDYEVYNEVVLGNFAGQLPGLAISTGSNCTTCAPVVRYDNQIIGLRALISF